MSIAIAPMLGRAPRLLMYAHDTYGLGHLRRSLAIAIHLSRAFPDLSTLLVTGSPVAHNFSLPPRVDYVKLPAVVKTGDERYQARDLDLSPDQILRLRSAIIMEVATHFAPDVMLVDHAPLGMKGELMSTLQAVRRDRPGTRLLLGLRDVLDEPEKVRRQWATQDLYRTIDATYDEVLVYGQRDIFDLVAAYAFPPQLAARTHFCGYIQREASVHLDATVRDELRLGTEPLVLVTAGGGEDGAGLLELSLDALALLAERRQALQAVIITGPLMAAAERARLEVRARQLPATVRVLPFHPNVPSLMRASAVVVSMGGYNTICEIATSGRPAVVVPRTHPRLEQYIRAQAFAARGLLSAQSMDRLTQAALAESIEQALQHGPPSTAIRAQWDGEGLSRIAAHVGQMLQAAHCTQRRASA
jgi:predicted glycosyltransferase